MSVLSSSQERNRIREILIRYLRLPFSYDGIPGDVMEAVLAHTRGAERLGTYDFVDVVDKSKGLGWQVKSTKSATPVTWKRAKIPNADSLISESKNGERGLQKLGNSIIGFCNEHAKESMEKYKLEKIGYARLVTNVNSIFYFEKELVSRQNPILFNPNDFIWRWSEQKKTKKKEQLSALHGIHMPTKKKWWAAHLLGENQLHFSGENNWWPPPNSSQRLEFARPSSSSRLSIEAFLALIDSARLS